MKFGQIVLRRSLLACAITCCTIPAFAAPPEHANAKRMAIQPAAAPYDKQAAKAERKAYHDWLVSERLPAASRNPLIARATDEQIAAVDGAPKQSPEIVGFTQDVGFEPAIRDVKLSRLRSGSQTLKYGAIKGTADGGYVYTAELSAPGALALRVQFAGFNLPAGAAVYLYTTDGQVFGPYAGKGPLGTGVFDSNTVLSDTLTLQLRQLGPASQKSLHETSFRIAGLGHIRPRLLQGQCDYNASCVESAACTSSSVVNEAEDAVALMLYRSGGSYYICSGGLINDDDTSNNLPLFLTANHCIRRDREASSLENFFQFKSDACGNTDECEWTLSNLPDTPRTIGSSIVSTGTAADYTLLRLAQAAPNGSAFLGWNATPVAFTNGFDLYRISHPGGAPQSYSRHDVDAGAPTCSSWPRGPRIYSRDAVGATEGGSSGSPVVNTAGEIVGQLSGACGTALNDECNTEDNATVDGAFASYFGAVEQFLDPDGGPGCTVTENPEVSCSDGNDNDCDGDTDGADSNCGTGGGLPLGSPCNVNADCASNNCKGKPGAKVCK